jgi:hypothetical protein
LAFFGFSSEGITNLTSLDVQRLIFKGVVMVGLVNGQKLHFERALWASGVLEDGVAGGGEGTRNHGGQDSGIR